MQCICGLQAVLEPGELGKQPRGQGPRVDVELDQAVDGTLQGGQGLAAQQLLIGGTPLENPAKLLYLLLLLAVLDQLLQHP